MDAGIDRIEGRKIFVSGRLRDGGDVLTDADVLDHVTAQLALLASLGIRLVVVHGGGPQASALTRRLGGEPVPGTGLGDRVPRAGDPGE